MSHPLIFFKKRVEKAKKYAECMPRCDLLFNTRLSETSIPEISRNLIANNLKI